MKCMKCGSRRVYSVEFRTDYANARDFTPVNDNLPYEPYIEIPYRMNGYYCMDCDAFCNVQKMTVGERQQDKKWCNKLQKIAKELFHKHKKSCKSWIYGDIEYCWKDGDVIHIGYQSGDLWCYSIEEGKLCWWKRK